MPEPESGAQRAARVMSELKVSGHLMTLEAGLYCFVQNPSRAAEAASGLPGVRLSPPPGPLGRPEALSILSFRNDGWLHGGGDAALVRVTGGPAQLLVTMYQSPNADASTAPNLQVVRLLEQAARPAVAPPPEPPAPQVVDVLAHVQGQGDVGGRLGGWIGERGSRRWIEGFAIAPASGIPADDIEYQAVLGRGWMSPWVEGGQFCGSRGMALPILGLRVRLRGDSAATHECSYAASFVDGASVGPVEGGEACEADSLAPVEAFSITIRLRGTAEAEPAIDEPDLEPVPEPEARTDSSQTATETAEPDAEEPDTATPPQDNSRAGSRRRR